MPDFIQLNRTFNVLSEYAQDALSIEIREELLGKETDWDEVLKQPRSVLLAEAGSGKTEEFRNRVNELNKKGEKSFFLYLEELANGLFLPESELDFDEWLQNEDMGYFFLDAVDEVKLKDLRAFETALKVFAQRVRRAFLRVHIVISSRASEWNGKEDLRIVERLLTPNLSEEEMKKGAFVPVVYLLKPLNGAQMFQYAEERGVKIPESFVDDIWIQGAQDFASRPLELEELISFWQRNGKIGSRKDIVEDSIKRKLREWNEERAATRSLSDDEARDGLKILAFALTMMKRSSFHVAVEHRCDSSVCAGDILQRWAPKKIKELLTLPVFSGEAYGRIRFQHRTIREYLASEKIFEMLDSGVSRRSVENLLFGKAHGEEFVVPSLEPVLAWIALRDEFICQKLLECSPETFIAHGDARALSLNTKTNILQSYANSVVHERHSKGWFYQPDVYRLAAPELSEAIKELYEEYKGHSEIEGLLLQLIYQGNNCDCCYIGREIAVRKGEQSSQKARGLRVVSISQDIEWKQQVIKVIRDGEECVLGDSEVATIINEFFPTVLSVQELVEVLKKFAPKDEFASDRAGVAIKELIPRLRNEKARSIFFTELKELLSKKPYIADSYCKVSRQYAWLLPYALQFLLVDVDSITLGSYPRHDDASALLKLASGVSGCGGGFYDSASVNSALERLLASQTLRFSVFNLVVTDEILKADHCSQLVALNGVHEGQLKIDDFNRMVQDFLAVDELKRKCVLLCAVHHLLRGGESKSKEQLVLIEEEIEGIPELKELWGRLRAPHKSSELELRLAREDAEREKIRVEQVGQEKRLLDEYKKGLLSRLNKLRVADDSCLNDLAYFTSKLKRKSGATRWAEVDWSSLTSKFGDEIASTVRDGMAQYWRKNTPIPQDLENSNSVPRLNITGLLGVGVDASEDSQWAKRITEKEARYAVEYALWEINGFPAWLKDLIEAHPATVDAYVKKQIRNELFLGKAKILHDILYHSEFLRERYQEYLLELFVDGLCDPAGDSLRYAHSILLSYGEVSQDKLAEVACHGLKKVEGSKLWLQWLGFAFKVDADVALEQLERQLGGLSFDEAKVYMASVCNALYSRYEERHPMRFEDYARADILERLIFLTYRYVNPEEDLYHEGAYSPNTRDNAQDARRHFVSLLMGCQENSVYISLCNLAGELDSEGVPNDFKWLAYDHARKSVKHDAWSESDVCLYVERAEKVPANLRELYKLACARIDDIKFNLESGRDSDAYIVKALQKETDLRKWIGKRLEVRGLGKYRKVEEEELADATRPDIHFHSHNIDSPVPIELKIADKKHWGGYNGFHERLETQLIGQYLADEKVQFGIYLLVNQSRNYWVVNGKRIMFEIMISDLQDYADNLVKSRSDIVEIKVVGINLNHRKEKAKLIGIE